MESGLWARDETSDDVFKVDIEDPFWSSEESPDMTHKDLVILRSIAIVAASISLISGLLVLYWFIRMKRSFRHQYVFTLLAAQMSPSAIFRWIWLMVIFYSLIMLLIFSDFWKASWQLIYPAVVFTKGRVNSASVFCQMTGFFMSMGIEASGKISTQFHHFAASYLPEIDFAVLVIAVHSALYIFRPVTTLGEGGLYRYRFYLYGIWLSFPLLMASLAFINGSLAYNSQGTYCYLPVSFSRPGFSWDIYADD